MARNKALRLRKGPDVFLFIIVRFLVDVGFCFGWMCQNGFTDMARSTFIFDSTTPKNPFTNEVRSDGILVKIGSFLNYLTVQMGCRSKDCWRTIDTSEVS